MEEPIPENKSIKKSIIIAVIIFIFDAFWLNQGMIAFITLVIVILFFLPKAIYLHVKKLGPKPQYFKCLIYIVMAFCVFGSNYMNNKIAHSRAEALIHSIEQYKNEKGVFPDNLEALTPDYIKSVPLAKYTFMHNRYQYFLIEGKASMWYVAFPPFGKATYYFSSRQWAYYD